MTTELFRKNMMLMFEQSREPDLALSARFLVRDGNMSDTELVSLDIVRSDEDVAAVVRALEGSNMNAVDFFVNKEFRPPSLNEGSAINVAQLLLRQPGQTEYAATDTPWLRSMVTQLQRNMRLMAAKIARNREWQASQILTTGILQLTDRNGVLAYEIDYKPKAAHFPTAGIAWNGVSPTILADISGLADTIRDNGLIDVDELWLGDDSFAAFRTDPDVRAHYDTEKMFLGELRPENLGAGAKFQGLIHIDNYKFKLITYNGRGILPAAASKTKFLPGDKVILMSEATRLDTLFAGVPRVVQVDSRFAGFLPDRIAIPGAIDMAPNIWASPDGKETRFDLESRPLLVPTQIDGFGCISTGV